MKDEIKHEDEEIVKSRLGLKTFTDSRLKRLGGRGLTESANKLIELFNVLDEKLLVVQHNQIEFGKYLDDIVERLKRIEER